MLLFVALIASFAKADDALEEALEVLRDPITIQTRIGRDFEGYPVSTSANALTLRVSVDGGSAELTFLREDVLQIRFPGNRLKQSALDLAEAGELSTALDVIDRIYAQRSAFFAYSGEREARFFAETIRFYREADRTLEGLARAEILQPLIDDPALRRSLRQEQLLGAHQLGMSDVARSRAEDWIAAEGREPESALGSLILAYDQLADRDGDAALFTLLHPIVFSGAREMEYLDLCYAFAIELATHLEHLELAANLSAERERRGLTPPDSWTPLATPDFSVFTTLQPPS